MKTADASLVRTESAPPYVPVAIISGAALAYELWLIRVMEILQWHHFAGLVISLALLGIGVSGTLVSIWQNSMLPKFDRLLPWLFLFFALSCVTSVIAAQWLPFNALALLWDNHQVLYLLGLYSVLSIPFCFAGSAVILSLRNSPAHSGRLYAADLVGAGLGALLITVSLNLWAPQSVLLTGVTLITLVAAGLRYQRSRFRSWQGFTAGVAVVIVAAVLFASSPLSISDYKPLSHSLRVPGSTVLYEHHHSRAHTTVVKNIDIPLRHAPDLSMYSQAMLPAQMAVFEDGESLSALNFYQGDKAALQYLDDLPSSLVFHARRDKPVKSLLVQGDLNTGLFLGIYHDVAQIELATNNPEFERLYSQIFRDETGYLFWHGSVQWHHQHWRALLAGEARRYDVIWMSMPAMASGLREQFVYSVNGINVAWQTLNPGGVLSITVPLQSPPNSLLKLINTLRVIQPAHFSEHVALVTGTRSATLLLSKQPWSSVSIQQMAQFARDRHFALTTHQLITSEASVHESVLDAITAHTRKIKGDYPFDVQATTDNRPYFFHFVDLRSAWKLWQLRQTGGLALLDWVYPMLWMALLQSVLLSVVLVLLPLLWRKATDKQVGQMHWPRWSFTGYFLSIGLAFMAMELTFLHRYILLLGQPLYAAAMVLGGFLIGAGVGSFYAANRPKSVSYLPFMALIVVALMELWIWSMSGEWLLSLSMSLRALLALLMILPLAFFLGMPMPMGLAHTARLAPHRLPWAWAINACASVVGALLATLMAVDVGYASVMLWSMVLYVLAYAMLPRAPHGKKDLAPSTTHGAEHG